MSSLSSINIAIIDKKDVINSATNEVLTVYYNVVDTKDTINSIAGVAVVGFGTIADTPDTAAGTASQSTVVPNVFVSNPRVKARKLTDKNRNNFAKNIGLGYFY